MVDTVTPGQFRDALDRGESFALIDTREESAFSSWRIAGARNYPFAPGDAVDAAAVERETGAGPDDRVVTVCAKGISSFEFAEGLEAAGYGDVTVVEDGMEGWSAVYDRVEVPTADDAVEIHQLQRRAKGCLGYLVGCPATGAAAVVDATRHAEEFRGAAADAGFDVEAVLDTHVHADHVSGGRRLADDLGVPYYLGARAAERGVEYEFEPLGRNEVVAVGDVDLKALYTPGHTAEQVSYLVGAEAVLTGDALFVDSVGRTELQFAADDGSGVDQPGTDESTAAGAESGARQLYRSLHWTLLAEPDRVTVLPGHFSVTDAGEYPEAEPGTPVRTTVGERRTGSDLLARSEDAFVAAITDDLPAKPPNYERIVAVNAGRESLDDEQEAVEIELGPNRCAAAGEGATGD